MALGVQMRVRIPALVTRLRSLKYKTLSVRRRERIPQGLDSPLWIPVRTLGYPFRVAGVNPAGATSAPDAMGGVLVRAIPSRWQRAGSIGECGRAVLCGIVAARSPQGVVELSGKLAVLSSRRTRVQIPSTLRFGLCANVTED